MRLGSLVVMAIAVFGHFESANGWNEDPRCPGYVDEGNRALDTIEPTLRLLEDSFADTGKGIDDSNAEVKSKKNLRGVHRQLDEVFNFQMKLYWEEGYCWQEEWDEREWCLECQGGSCSKDDNLLIQKCDNDEEQRFTYEIIDAATQAVKIKPLERQDLCWTRVAINEHQLQPCGDGFMDEITGLNKQVFLGFTEGGSFELHPNDGVVSETRCMCNHHHPKADEIVKGDYCRTCEKDKVNQWIVFNAEGPSQGLLTTANPPTSPLTPSPEESATLAPPLTTSGVGDGSLPKVEPVSASYCTEKSPCPQCYGDCDDDEDCQGNLKCYQRDGGQAVPSCSGGEDEPSITDYCIDPAAVA